MTPYADIATADSYFSERFDSGAWDEAGDTDRLKALQTATRAIDRLNLRGKKTVSTQERQFPRDDDTVIPTDIEAACAEIAYALLDGIEPELEFDNLDMVSQGYGNVRTTYSRTIKPPHILAGIVSIVAWRFLLPYLRDGRLVEMTRV